MSTNENRYTKDLDKGLVSREIFFRKDIYEQEQEQLFSRAWLLLGHESLIPNKGDFFASRMGEESVVLTRDALGKIHAFLNSCVHRGMKVCRYDMGNSRVLECPYHGWGYSLDGRLAAVPNEEAYFGVLDRSRWGLKEVSRIAIYKGSIWASWDPEAPDFEEYLGEDGLLHLDTLLDTRDGRPGSIETVEVIPGIQKGLVPCNWKFGAENFIGDGYHNHSHRSVDLVGIGPSGKGRRDEEEMFSEKAIVRAWNLPLGHGGLASLQNTDLPYIPVYKDTPLVDDWFRKCYTERRKRLGAQSRLYGGVGTIFPNMSFHATQPRSMFVWHPNGPTQMEYWRFYLVDRDAPQEVKEVLRHYYMRYSGPAGMTEQDDMENWNYATSASAGAIARKLPYNYQLGLGRGGKSLAGMPGRISEHMLCEDNQRNFYRVWGLLMDGQDWQSVKAMTSA